MRWRKRPALVAIAIPLAVADISVRASANTDMPQTTWVLGWLEGDVDDRPPFPACAGTRDIPAIRTGLAYSDLGQPLPEARGLLHEGL